MHGGDDTLTEPMTEIDALRGQLQELKRTLLAAKTEAVLQRARADEYRLLYERTPLPYQSLNEAGYFMEVNPAWLAVTGYSRDEVVGSYFGDFLTPQFRDLFPERFAHFKATGEMHGLEFDLVHRDGTVIPASFDGVIGRREDGSFRQTHCVMRDLSAQRRAEEEVKATGQQLRDAAMLAPLPMGMYTEDGEILLLNRAWLELSGYSMEELTSVNAWRERVYGERAAEIGAEIDSVFATEGRVHQGEREITAASGEKRTWDFNVSQLSRLPNGRRSAISIAMDVTERKASEAKIAQLSRLYRFLSEVNQAIVRTHSEEELFDQVCRVAIEHGGFALAWIGLVEEGGDRVIPKAIYGDGVDVVKRMRISSADIPEGRGVVGSAIRTGTCMVCNDILSDEGMARWREEALLLGFNSCAAFPIKLGDRVIGAMCMDSRKRGFFDREETRLLEELAGDIAYALRTMESDRQRKATEAALRESEERYRSLFQNSVEAVLLTVPGTGIILAANPAATRMFGYSEAELSRLGRFAIVDEDDPRWAAAAEERARTGRVSAEVTFKRADGSRFEAEMTSVIFHDGEGQVRTSMFIRDISERKWIEEQLLRAQRLEMAGRVAGQVAHDFNNLLGPVMAYPDMIASELPAGSPALEFCGTIVEAAQHMAEINDDLLALARRGRLETESVDMNRLILQSVEQMNDLGTGLALDLRLQSDLLPAEGSASQLLRVFQNLISNARDAMRDTGILTVTTDNVYVDAPMGAYNRVEQGEYVRLSVSDTGAGIPESIRDRIFDAFFSTKRGSRRGCGLGLTVVQSIVEDHHGFIDLVTEEGSGTTFTVYLPVSRGVLEQVRRESQPAGHERILVVDDDPLQRRVLAEILRSRGYEVEAVASGEDALVRVKDKRPDLIVLDMVMPGRMDGAETYRRILADQARQKAILISGYADTEQVQACLALGAGAFLRKPVTMEQLLTAVGQELSSQL